jgi:hypothetical protein
MICFKIESEMAAVTPLYRIASTCLGVLMPLLIILLFMLPQVSLATTVYYFPSNYDGSNGGRSDDVTTIANYAPICQSSSGVRLAGLNLVRAFAGAATCPRTSENTEFDSPIDFVFLVDDTRPLSEYMLAQLQAKNLLKTHQGRQIVDSSTVPMIRNGEDSGLDILVVGEMDYVISGGSPTSWFAALSDQTGNMICDIASEHQSIIADFATQTYQMNEAVVRAMQDGLNSFETQMSFDSSYNAQARIGAALGKVAVKQAKAFIVGKVAGQVPGFNILVDFVDSANAEMERAATASRSQSMGSWITTTRTFISNCLGNSRCRNGASGTIDQLSSVSIREHVEMAYCRLPQNRKAQGIASIQSALNNSLVTGRDNIKLIEKGFYESWINSQYRASDMTDDSSSGTIEVVWEVEDDNGTLSFDSSSHINKVNVADYGDNADDGMNSIIDAISSISQPWDFAVKKKVCFIVDNVVGGTSRECALLDDDNDVLYRVGGSTDLPARAFQSDVWRQRTTRFKR